MSRWPTPAEVVEILRDYIAGHAVEDDGTVPPDPDDEMTQEEIWKAMPDSHLYDDDREPRWAPDQVWDLGDGIVFTEAEWREYEETGVRPPSWPEEG